MARADFNSDAAVLCVRVLDSSDADIAQVGSRIDRLHRASVFVRERLRATQKRIARVREIIGDVDRRRGELMRRKLDMLHSLSMCCELAGSYFPRSSLNGAIYQRECSRV